jgi:hypothetical protein
MNADHVIASEARQSADSTLATDNWQPVFYLSLLTSHFSPVTFPLRARHASGTIFY